jgi:hypothetical protein
MKPPNAGTGIAEEVCRQRGKDMVKRRKIGRLAIALVMSGALSMGAAAPALGREG